jgi:2'-phosphotransferase
MSNHIKRNKISKTLSYILRHGALKYNIDIDRYGYIKTDDILKLPQFYNVTLDDIFEIVYDDSRGRYTIKESLDTFYIKANHGHSILIPNSPIKKILNTNSYKVLSYECTYQEWIIIKGNKGLQRKNIELKVPKKNYNRNYISYNKSVIIYINLEKALAQGFEFNMYSNGKILTQGLNGFMSIDFFANVYDIKSDSYFVF